ncbi:MAG: chemotaxis protein CheW [Verrucomicrobiales bacterium]|nr:chemotaxis protein CheW [Verrucomicrobiales bacterium]
MSKSIQYCTFFLGQFFFGVEVRRVQEVIRYQRMTRVPLASAVIRGLINLRGQIVTALDLRERLGLPPRADGKLPMNVIVRTDDGAVSLLVDEIGEVIDMDEASFERPPETLRGPAREIIQTVCKLEGRLLLLLDTEKAITPGK